ncbi:hypothetical protein EIP91_010854 [Steccherinum ochraceum]|uniref:Arabinan endo-1,5-alpha-L-arabinosidase n=1 Tax=Steccherinum ochraceum TaxID=92696 RepID=A0A4R0R2P2_9APHY|nr:hypothetical protein EIP91_010854 [Steccherinum ochraceum]
MHFFTLFSLLFSLTCVSNAQWPDPRPLTGDTAVHDPTICKDNSGTYWVFATGTRLTIKTSKDLTNWTSEGLVWPAGAPWTDQFTLTSNGALWAPDCTYIDGVFWLYYTASSFGSQDSGIFLAKSTSGLPGSWSNEGLVTSTSTANDYNAIDPNLIIDQGKWYLSFGSFWSGIKLLNLNGSNGLPTSQAVTALAERTADNGAIEASVIYSYNSQFYLFTSWDNCCQGVNSTYNIRVGRSSSVSGPYVDATGVPLLSGGGTLVLGTHGSIVGPGGQDIITDEVGPLMVYHYYTPTGSFLGINRLNFSTGWPVVV